MTNTTTPSTPGTVQGFSAQTVSHSDSAPMVVTRLSGWIDVTETEAATPSWIIRTRSEARRG